MNTTDANGQGQSFKGFSRLARLTNAAEVSAAAAKASGRGNNWYAVDGYQPTNDLTWRFNDSTPISNFFPTISRYQLTPNTTWSDAQRYAYGLDGELVKIENASENAELDAKFGDSWIGAQRTSYGGGFQWLDGTGLSYSNWAGGEPNNAGPWSTVFSNNFDSNTIGASRGDRRGFNYGTYLGRFGRDNGYDWDFALGTNWGGGSLDSDKPTMITFDFLRMDSWDEEAFRMRIGPGDDRLGYEGSTNFAFNRQEGPFTLVNKSGYVATFRPTRFGQFMNSGWNDQSFSVTVTLPPGLTSWAIYFDGRTDQDHGDEAYAIDNLVVQQNAGEPYVHMYDGGRWNDLPPSSTRPGIAEIKVPGINWAPGEPNDLGGVGRNDQNYLGMYANGTFDDGGPGSSWYISQAAPVWGPSRDLRETFYDYKYDWMSVPMDVLDPRLNYRYAATSTIAPIYEAQPLYHQDVVTTVSTVSKLTPRLVNQAKYTTQAVTTGVTTSYTTNFRLSDAVPFDSIKGNRITINTTGSGATTVSGNIKATATTTPANGVNLGLISTGPLNLGNGTATAVTSTLVANSFKIKAAGLTLENDLLISGANSSQPQALSLDAGSAALSLQNSFVPVGSLTLKGGSLRLPASARSLFSAQSLSLAAGSTLTVTQQEPNAQLLLAISSAADGTPTALNLSGSDGITSQAFDNPLNAWATAPSLNAVPLVLGSGTSTALGLFANGDKVANQDVWTNLNFNNGGGSISFDLLRLDRWEKGESFRVFANDAPILSSTFDGSTNVTAVGSGSTDGYTWSMTPVDNFGSLGGNASAPDQTFRVTIKVPAGVAKLKLGFGSTLDQPTSDESYAIDNFAVTPNLGQATVAESFEQVLDGWQRPVSITAPPFSLNSSANGGIGNVLGLFANGPKSNGQDIWRTFGLSGDGGRVSFDLHRIDSWENEVFNLYANDSVVASATFQGSTSVAAPINGSTASGYSYTITPLAVATNIAGDAAWKDQSFRVTLDVPAGVPSLKLGFGSNLNEAADNEAYAIDNLRVFDAGSLAITDLSTTLPLLITTAGSLALSNSIKTAGLDLAVGSLSVANGTSQSATGPLNLRLTGSATTNLAAFALTAPTIALDSQAGGTFRLSAPTIQLSSRDSLAVVAAGSGTTTLSLKSSAGKVSFSSPGALTVADLSAGQGTVDLTAASGDLVLGAVTQSPGGALSLSASAGKVTSQASQARSIGALTLVARDGVDLTATQIRSFTASTTAADSDILLVAATPGSIALGNLSAPDQISITNSQGALLLSNPVGISAAALTLSAQDALQISATAPVTLSAAKSLTLTARNLDANLDQLVLKTNLPGGQTWLNLTGLTAADAVKLPLIDSPNLTFESSTGLRLRPDAFPAKQASKPLSSITFLRKETALDQVALRHPYLADSQLLLGSDGRYYGFTATKSLQTHFDLATGKYTFTALTASDSGLSSIPITITSNDYQLTVANLASATLPAGVSPSQVVPATIAPSFRPAPAGISASPASGTPAGQPRADAVGAASANARVSIIAGSTSQAIPAGYVKLDQTDAIRELVKSGLDYPARSAQAALGP